MTKRFICFLLAAALLACSAFAAAPETSPEPAQHKINISCDARFGSVNLDSQTGAFGDNIYFHVSATEDFAVSKTRKSPPPPARPCSATSRMTRTASMTTISLCPTRT